MAVENSKHMLCAGSFIYLAQNYSSPFVFYVLMEVFIFLCIYSTCVPSNKKL